MLLGNTLLQQIEQFRVVHGSGEEGGRVSSVGGSGRHVDGEGKFVDGVERGEVEAGLQGGLDRRRVVRRGSKSELDREEGRKVERIDRR